MIRDKGLWLAVLIGAELAVTVAVLFVLVVNAR